jgi:DegV family protein with EDD domain
MIRIVVDSSCDIPPALVDQYGIRVVPLTIRFGSQEYTDGLDLDHEGFWSRLASSEELPETAAPAAGAFVDTFEALKAERAAGVVVVTLSSELSGTYQSAVIAAERMAPELDVRVVDSGSVSMAAGFQALAAARAAQDGAEIGHVVSAAVSSRERTQIFAALDTLEYLKRGGRVGNTAAFFGTLLNVKPLITLAEGVVSAAGRARTRTKAVAAVLDHLAAQSNIAELAILHGAASDLEEFRDRLGSVTDAPIIDAELGPVVGTHAGPGVIGVAYRLG